MNEAWDCSRFWPCLRGDGATMLGFLDVLLNAEAVGDLCKIPP